MVSTRVHHQEYRFLEEWLQGSRFSSTQADPFSRFRYHRSKPCTHRKPVMLCASFFSHTAEILGIRWHWTLRFCSFTNTIIFWSERASICQHFHFTFRIRHSCSVTQSTFPHNLRLHILTAVHYFQRPCLWQTFSPWRVLSVFQSSHHSPLSSQGLDASRKWL